MIGAANKESYEKSKHKPYMKDYTNGNNQKNLPGNCFHFELSVTERNRLTKIESLLKILLVCMCVCVNMNKNVTKHIALLPNQVQRF